MRFERTRPRPFVPPVDLGQLFEHLRVSGHLDLEAEAVRLATASAWEIEDRAQIALLTQTVRASAKGPILCGQPYDLPLGPVLNGGAVSVRVGRFHDEPPLQLTSAQYVLRYGSRARLYLIDDGSLPRWLGDHGTTLVVDYSAGFGSAPSDIPPDLAYAVMDQAASAFDTRGTGRWRGDTGLSPHAARVIANYRGVAL